MGGTPKLEQGEWEGTGESGGSVLGLNQLFMEEVTPNSVTLSYTPAQWDGAHNGTTGGCETQQEGPTHTLGGRTAAPPPPSPPSPRGDGRGGRGGRNKQKKKTKPKKQRPSHKSQVSTARLLLLGFFLIVARNLCADTNSLW